MVDFSFLFFYKFDLIFHLVFVKIDDKKKFSEKYFCKVQVFF